MKNKNNKGQFSDCKENLIYVFEDRNIFILFFFLLYVLSVTKEIFAFRPETNNVDGLSDSYASLSVTV